MVCAGGAHGDYFDEELGEIPQMLLGQLLEALPAALISGRVDHNILGIESDYRRVKPGDLFVAARWGVSDGHDRVKEAISGGATALVLERELPLESRDITRIFVDNSRQALARLASRFHGDPAQHLIIIGVTGTKGKTTTCHLIKSIFDHASLPAGFIGTAGCDIGGQIRAVPRPAFTTPMPTDLHRFLAEMVKAGQKAVALEVTSRALALERLHGLPFAVAVFTNLGRDHIVFHGSEEAYFTAKASLFESLTADERPRAIINIDDPWGRRLLERTTAKPMTYGSHADATVRLAATEITNSGSRVCVQTPQGEVHIELSLLGRLHSVNALAALAVGLAWGLPVEVIRRGLESVKAVPGRLEPIQAGQPFSVIVDSAYSPDSLERLLRAARPLTRDRLILVFGCEGDRHPAQRAFMGSMAARFADLSIITADNPRHEDPDAIARDIVAGMESATHHIIWDRREAISFAVEQARDGDIIVIAGKGDETVQLIGDEIIHFDDREIASEVLRRRYPP